MPLSILADENIDKAVITYLRNSGHSVLSVYEDYRGVSDIEIIELARKHSALVLTEDKDFGEWVFSHNEDNFSIVLLRYSEDMKEKMISSLLTVLADVNDIDHKFIVISPTKIRIRDV